MIAVSRKRIAIFGGGFNPPGLHHVYMLYTLLQEEFDIAVIPSGNSRPDKAIVDVELYHRIRLIELGFKIFLGNDIVQLDLFDLENSVFTRTHELQERYETKGEVWHVVGADWVVGGRFGGSLVQLEWQKGQEIWKNFNFSVFEREGYRIMPGDLPPKSHLMSSLKEGSSSEIRERIAGGKPFDHLVMPDVAEYIREHQLYLQEGERT